MKGVDLAAWPPRYDRSYRPAPSDRYWFAEIECAPRAELEEIIFAKLLAQIRYAWEKSPFYRRKWEAAGVSPDTLGSLEDLSRFPVVQKQELRESQAALPPYGEYL
jgi:phenylacetate-CoA ligase